MDNFNARVSHDGNPPFVRVSPLEHTERGGIHIFKSKQIQGLLVMHRSLETAIAQLPVVIAELILLNEGLNCSVTLGIDKTPSDKIEEPDYAVMHFEKAA